MIKLNRRILPETTAEESSAILPVAAADMKENINFAGSIRFIIFIT